VTLSNPLVETGRVALGGLHLTHGLVFCLPELRQLVEVLLSQSTESERLLGLVVAAQ